MGQMNLKARRVIVVVACDNQGSVPDFAQWNAPPQFPNTKAIVLLLDCCSGGQSDFIASDKHRLKISAIANTLGSGDHTWSEAVKRYLVDQHSYVRSTGAIVANVVYNGEILVNSAHDPVYQLPPNGKRQIGDSCTPPENDPSSSLPPTSSIGSGTSAPTSSIIPPLSSDGPVTSNYNVISSTPVASSSSAVANHIRKTCIRSWTWTTKGSPPSAAQTLGISVLSTSSFDVIDTLGQIHALDPTAGVCSGGKYPRHLSSTECQEALLALSQNNYQGWIYFVVYGRWFWVSYFLHEGVYDCTNQHNRGTSPTADVHNPPAFIPEIARRDCHESKGLMPVDFRLFDTAIQNFCAQEFTWEKNDSPSVVRTTSPGEFTLTLQAKPAPFKAGSNEAVTCKVDNYPRVLTPDVCNYGFKAFNLNDCPYGAEAQVSTPSGCVLVDIFQCKN
ncbi:hypothetical protein DL98DRAFT_637165 [Cadophora sp. DSE1049]|nr:hypothetical protein DL98DRAFT_637165 [Cadophora sp. DSE1049]